MPTPTYGTVTTLDSIRTVTDTVERFGEDRIYEAVARELEIYNAQIAEALGAFVERTQDRLRRFGDYTYMTMKRVGQGGAPPAQKSTFAGYNIGFPLEDWQLAIQWTKLAFRRLPARQIARDTDTAILTDRRNIMWAFKTALFTPTNRTVTDERTDEPTIDLPVKALLNADSSQIPRGPDNETFDGTTHTHYLATASFTAANLTALIDTVTEHYADAEIEVYINKAQVATVAGFTGFAAYQLDPALPGADTTGAGVTATATNRRYRTNNRPIGRYAGAEIWVKPWVPASYAVAINRNAPGRTLAMRTFSDEDGNFRLVYEDETHPLRAQFFAREFGMGAWERQGAAVLYTGGGAYVTPTFTL